jgi:uncharacterized protein with HEPN domain
MKNSPESDKVRLLHILEAISEIESYLSNCDHGDFLDSSLIRNATLMQVQIVGEATSHIGTALKNAFPEVEWKQIKSTRNIIAHEYFGIDFEIIWNIAFYKLPVFKGQIRQILKETFKEDF